MKIVFMGTPQAAAVSLERLIGAGHDVTAVYTQPDRPSGRGKRILFSTVKEFALSRNLPVFQPASLKTPEAIQTFGDHEADAAVVVAYGRILPPEFLSAFQYGALNVHFSLLPRYRGAAPVNWAIVYGESETGVTVMQMDAGLDTGDILLQRSTPIGSQETAIELTARLSDLGADLICDAVGRIDQLRPVPQDETAASVAPMLHKADGLIDWNLSAVEIERRVRGFQPFPTAYTFHDQRRLTLWHAGVIADVDTERPGTIVGTGELTIRVACGSRTILEIDEIQPEGKRRMSVRDYLNGARIEPGDIFGHPVAVGR